jgi:hypothetical protein
MPGGFGPGETESYSAPRVLGRVSCCVLINPPASALCACAFFQPPFTAPAGSAAGGPLSRMGGGKNGGRGGGGGFFGMAKANVTSVDKNAKDKVSLCCMIGEGAREGVYEKGCVCVCASGRGHSPTTPPPPTRFVFCVAMLQWL